MPKLSLPTVTLCCVDCTSYLPMALKAMERSLDRLAVADAIVMADSDSMRGLELPAGVRWVPIERLTSVEAYSVFMLKELGRHVQTPHVLVMQWDGFVLNPEAWTDRFLEFDYVGAPWNHLSPPWNVGNGGFSLRSRRLLLELQDAAVTASHPEDVCLCIEHRALLEARGMRFAPLDVAARFAVEDGELSQQVFGFHGVHHLPHVLVPAETLAWVQSLDVGFLRSDHLGRVLRELRKASRESREAHLALDVLERLIAKGVAEMQGAELLTRSALSLCKELIRRGQLAAAADLLRARRKARARLNWPDIRLWIRLHAQSVRRTFKRP